MSSFQKRFLRCVYCQQKFPLQRNLRCTKCLLWQPKAKVRFAKNNRGTLQRAYVINLNKDQNRWLLFLKKLQNPTLQANQSAIKFKRYSAIDGTDNQFIQFTLETLFPEKKALQEKALALWQKKPGSMGCYLSHLTLWHYLLHSANSKEQEFLIMEDDAYWMPHGIQNLKILLGSIRSWNWDILYVGHNALKGRQIAPLLLVPRMARKGERMIGFNSGFFGYVVKKRSLKKLIGLAETFASPFIDDVFRRYFSVIKALFVIQPLIRHHEFGSSRKKGDLKRKVIKNRKFF